MFLLLVVALGIFFAARFVGARYTANRVYGDYAGGIGVLLFCLGLVLYPLSFSTESSRDRAPSHVSPQSSMTVESRASQPDKLRRGPFGIESIKQAATLMDQGVHKGLYRVDTTGTPGLKGNTATQQTAMTLVVGQWITFEAHLVGGAASGSGGRGYGIGLFDEANSGLALDATNNLIYVFAYNNGTYNGNLWSHPLNLQDGKMHKFALRMTLIGGSNTIRFIGYVDGAKVVEQTTTSITTMGVPGPAVFGEVARDVYFRPDLKFSTYS